MHYIGSIYFILFLSCSYLEVVFIDVFQSYRHVDII